jgi:hypothetical protein
MPGYRRLSPDQRIRCRTTTIKEPLGRAPRESEGSWELLPDAIREVMFAIIDSRTTATKTATTGSLTWGQARLYWEPRGIAL